MALAVSTLTSGSDTTNNPCSTASVNPTSGSLTLIWIGYAVVGGGTTTSTDTVVPSGARGTWTLLDDVSDNTHTTGRRGMRLYAGTGTVTNEAISITATCGAGTWTETVWIVDEWTGVDGTTPYDASVSTGSGSGTTGTISDVGTPDTGDRITSGWFHETTQALTATGLTALGSVTSTSDLSQLKSYYDASDPQDETPEVTWSSSCAWGGIGLIINAAAGGGASAPKRSLLLGIG